jgi:hypothetical protein
MSWSVNASGTPEEVKTALQDEFASPLDDTNGLPDAGEKETVRKVSDAIMHTLDTFDPEKLVTVSASGHMGFDNLDTKTGTYQSVSMSIAPAR